MKRRQFLAGLGWGLSSTASVLAQQGGRPIAAGRSAGDGRRSIAHAMAKTTKLFKAPGLYPNALALMTDAPGGLWIGQQKSSAQIAASGNQPGARDESAWLVDWNGKLLKTVTTHSRNTSGMAYGGGFVWMGANAAPFGIFQVDMDSREVSHRQIPLSLDSNGGGCHGCQWHEGKLWIAALRLGGALRVDPNTWAAEALIRVSSTEKPRLHDLTFDNDGNMWVVTGNNSSSYAEGRPGLSKYDGRNGELLMTVDFVPGSCDPHGLIWHDGKLVSCDAGIHPGWKDEESPSTGYIFSIELV
jgi:hypothetical protein